MTLIICPGVHDSALSDRFCQALDQQLSKTVSPAGETPSQPTAVLPTQQHAPFDGLAVWSYWQAVAAPHQPLLLVAFSAGVVGAIAAAQFWQAQGRQIGAMIAIDGWGVPQIGEFPFYRMSHDHFTAWSSSVLGAGQDSFYAEPPVEHLTLWQYPDRAVGIWQSSDNASAHPPKRVTAIAFIAALLCRHGCGYPLDFIPR